MSQQLEQLFSFNDQLTKIVEEKLNEGIKDDSSFSLFLAFVLAKAFKTHEATILLCKSWYGEDAFMLARTLFELAVITSYILQDKIEGRLFRYMEYDWVTRKEMYDYVSSKDELLEELNREVNSGSRKPGVIEQVEREYKRVMEKYRYDRSGWSDKSIAKMAESVGRADAYRTVYRLQCMISHTNARSMNEYVKENGDGLVINIGRNDDLVEKTLVIVFDFFRMIIEEADKQFKWNIEDTLKIIYEKYVQSVGRPNAK